MCQRHTNTLVNRQHKKLDLAPKSSVRNQIRQQQKASKQHLNNNFYNVTRHSHEIFLKRKCFLVVNG
ncbi:hypothetical protein O6P43_013965 [Quillaja saponaria]|uniref:Uncharacterized protein n=1 Tax=Quillaja saponaria TaxID=32244 RepID=A0AAD7LTN1_QUISA|nr:hypothetical protein O6P43_013965 [Quillaja saponaria]